MDFHLLRRPRLIILLSGACVLATGCANTPPPAVGPVTAQPIAAMGHQDYATSQLADYVIQPADAISVTVFREPDLSIASVPVGIDGQVSLPLIGIVDLNGMTVATAAQAIERKLRQGYLRDPHVAVNVVSYASHQVTVEGSVSKPGIYPFTPGTRLSGAIALGGGPVRVAKQSQIAVFRDTPQGIAVAKFDYRAIQAGTMIDPVLEPGDRVVIGTSALSQVWQDLLMSTPLFATFYRF